MHLKDALDLARPRRRRCFVIGGGRFIPSFGTGGGRAVHHPRGRQSQGTRTILDGGKGGRKRSSRHKADENDHAFRVEHRQHERFCAGPPHITDWEGDHAVFVGAGGRYDFVTGKAAAATAFTLGHNLTLAHRLVDVFRFQGLGSVLIPVTILATALGLFFAEVVQIRSRTPWRRASG